MSRLVLVERCPAQFSPQPGDTVVGVTAEACYELERRSLPHLVTTDLASDADLAALEPDHWWRQLEWLGQLDEVVANHVPKTRSWRLGAARLWGYHIKLMLDNILIRGFELDRMLSGHASVTLYAEPATEPALGPYLFFRGPSVYSRLLPLFADARGVEYRECRVSRPSWAAGDQVVPGLKAALLPTYRGLRAAYRVLRGLQQSGRSSARSGDRLTPLFLDEGYGLSQLLAEAHAAGHRCLFVIGDRLFEHGGSTRALARLPGRVTASEPWRAAASTIAQRTHPLWEWPDGWYGIPVSELIRPRLAYWLTQLMPTMEVRAQAWREIYERYSIDLVLTTSITRLDAMATTAVAGGATETALLDHGDVVWDCELAGITVLLPFDHTFAPTEEYADRLRAQGDLYSERTAEPHVGSRRWEANASLADRKRRGRAPARIAPDRPVVVYALTALAGDARYLNNAWYPDGFYYRLVRAIVDVLAERSDITAIVKGFPGDPHARNPIDRYVADLGREHMIFSRAPLRDWLRWSDRMIFDFPSTGLHEAAIAGVPRLALIYEHHRHRPAAVAAVAPYVASFRTTDQAAAAVRRFLEAESVAGDRVVPEGRDVLGQLEEIVSATRAGR